MVEVSGLYAKQVFDMYTTLGGRVTCTQCSAMHYLSGLGKGVKRQRSKARPSVDSTEAEAQGLKQLRGKLR